MPYIDFQAIKQAISIDRAAQLLSLEMKHSASQLRGCCPACQTEDDRALAITPSKGVFFCHSAQKGGDVIALVAHILNLGMRDAAEWLHETLPSQEREPPQQRTQQAPRPQATAKPPEGFDPDKFAQKHSYDGEIDGLSAETAKLHRIGFQRGKLYLPICPPGVRPAAFAQVIDGKVRLPDDWLTVTPMKRRA